MRGDGGGPVAPDLVLGIARRRVVPMALVIAIRRMNRDARTRHVAGRGVRRQHRDAQSRDGAYSILQGSQKEAPKWLAALTSNRGPVITFRDAIVARRAACS